MEYTKQNYGYYSLKTILDFVEMDKQQQTSLRDVLVSKKATIESDSDEIIEFYRNSMTFDDFAEKMKEVGLEDEALDQWHELNHLYTDK